MRISSEYLLLTSMAGQTSWLIVQTFKMFTTPSCLKVSRSKLLRDSDFNGSKLKHFNAYRTYVSSRDQKSADYMIMT